MILYDVPFLRLVLHAFYCKSHPQVVFWKLIRDRFYGLSLNCEKMLFCLLNWCVCLFFTTFAKVGGFFFAKLRFLFVADLIKLCKYKWQQWLQTTQHWVNTHNTCIYYVYVCVRRKDVNVVPGMKYTQTQAQSLPFLRDKIHAIVVYTAILVKVQISHSQNFHHRDMLNFLWELYPCFMSTSPNTLSFRRQLCHWHNPRHKKVQKLCLCSSCRQTTLWMSGGKYLGCVSSGNRVYSLPR